jgi:hypothetical protein
MLRCIERYKVFGYGDFAVGDIIDNPELESRLLVDSPGAFEPVEVDTTAPQEPEEHKAVLTKRGRKNADL